MSATDSHPKPEQSSEGTNINGALLVIAIALVVFALGVGWAYRILASETALLEPNGPAPVPAEIGQEQIGIVDQREFAHGGRAAEVRQQQVEQLSSYGWVDREKRLIHIPIERAMELVAQQGKKR